MIRALLFFTLIFSIHAEEICVVTSSINKQSYSYHDLESIFMGKGGNVPIADNLPIRKNFYSIFFEMDEKSALKIWARLVFSGKRSPKELLESNQEVLEWLKRHPTGISYLHNCPMSDKYRKIMTRQ